MGKKYKKAKAKPVNVVKTPQVANNAYGLDAGAYSPNRSFNMFPVVQRRDITACKRNKIISRSRSLYYNSPEVRSAVKTLSMLVGSLKPLAKSKDVEWNKLAEEAFTKRVSNPQSFELTGTLNFEQLQNFVEECAVVDGDVLVVFTNNGNIAVYPADMIAKNSNNNGTITDGVEVDSYGKPLYYYLKAKDKEIKVKASSCFLYRHNPDPTDPRGLTDLIATITTAQDLYELNSYNKQSVKLSASLGLVETVDNNVKRTDVSDLNLLRNGGTMGMQCQCEQPQNYNSSLLINGVKAVTMSPGHDLKTIADNRPSNEVRNFARDLVDSIAHSVGLDPEILYRVKEMGSASVRFCIAKCKDWAKPRIADKALLCTRIWQHVIASEIAAGRLRTCKDIDSMFNVQWIGNNQWSIDLGRDASTAISLMREGLMSRQDYTIEYFGKTYEQVIEENAASAQKLIEACKKYNVPVALVLPGQVGGQITSIEENGQSDEQQQENERA